MPTYEYTCPDGHHFDLFQKVTSRPRAQCPECGKVATRRISGGSGLVFKGSGFYITDYGKDGKGPRKGGDGEGASGTAPKADATTSGPKESKPAGKPSKASE